MHSFRWQTDGVLFESRGGHSPDALPFNQWQATAQTIPQSLDENARLNLWLFRGRRPSNGQEVEIIINRFELVEEP